MIIKVKVFAESLNIILKNETSVQVNEGSTLADLFTMLESCYPDVQHKIFTQPGVLSSLVNVFVNGKKVRHNDVRSIVLKEGELVGLFIIKEATYSAPFPENENA